MILTIKLRLRDKHAAELNRQARAVNYVWNYCNEMQMKAAKSGRKWLNDVALQRLTAGSSKELRLDSHTIQKVCQQYHRSRMQHKKAWLRFRGRKCLGWVPFNQGKIHLGGRSFMFRDICYTPMHWRDLPDGTVVRAGSFNQDSRGRWYINMPVEFSDTAFQRSGSAVVGIDLGLKDIAVLSTGERIGAPQHYRQHEAALGSARRANKKQRTRALEAKIANCRKDHLHKASARIAFAHGAIVVGNASSKQLGQTSMAKSIYDASWHVFKQQLEYKAIRHGSTFLEVEEAYTSQTCSACGALPEGRPKGIAGLAVRQWDCSECGAMHDRDVNAAINIVRRGLATLAEGAVS